MSVNQISNLNIEMQNVFPAQAFIPAERSAEEISADVKQELRSDLPEDNAEEISRKTCSCVDIYA